MITGVTCERDNSLRGPLCALRKDGTLREEGGTILQRYQEELEGVLDLSRDVSMGSGHMTTHVLIRVLGPTTFMLNDRPNLDG